jgi:hypothetical protein
MKKALLLSIFILLNSGCKKNDSSVNSSNMFLYSVDQVKYWAGPTSGTQVRVYSTADTIADVRLISDGSQVSPSTWSSYRTIKGLYAEIAKWDTASFIVIDTSDASGEYLRYLSVHQKAVTPGGPDFVFITSNLHYTQY